MKTPHSIGLGHRPKRVKSLTFLTLLVLSHFVADSFYAQGGKNKKRKNKPDAKDTDTWTAEEYSGLRGEKELQAAMASKGFTWITGSPADNEKLSVGKNAQFFGFVALRYQSGRAANRGTLGRAVFSIASEEQREVMARAAMEQKPVLEEWWQVRDEILTELENHLYTGEVIKEDILLEASERYSLLNSRVGIIEARALAALEDTLSEAQKNHLTGWRADAESAGKHGDGIRVTADGMERSDLKQLEDLYAKAFSWLTGTPEDNEIIPIGQPAQFFGFVSIRHKSGHAANRGKIAKDFLALLNDEQKGFVSRAVEMQTPVVKEFLEKRHEFLNQLALLRTDANSYDQDKAEFLSKEMGRLEGEAAKIEAEAYRKIRSTMDDAQLAAAMKLRGEYILDDSQVATLDIAERGKTLAILCSGCHGAPGQHRAGMPAPSLDGMWDRPIATGENFDYSEAMKTTRSSHGEKWTPELLDQFLAGPKKFAPGTKMEFQGLLKEEDREALIQYLRKTR